MGDVADKLAYFQAITGLEDTDLCTEILSAHNWDLELAISSITATDNNRPSSSSSASATTVANQDPQDLRVNFWSDWVRYAGCRRRFVLFPKHGWLGRAGRAGTTPLVSVPQSTSEAMDFVSSFERDYGRMRPNFVTEAFLNENFVAWGGSVKASEGFKMSNSLKASRFPFCAVVMAATNQRMALLQQAEGPKSPEEMLTLLQKVLEESAPVLVSARIEAEERRNNRRLREEQDAAYRAALEADQARERQRKEEQERLEREAAEAERKRKEEEEAREREAREAAEREAALAKIREEKALSLGAEPEKGPDVTQILVRFPSGERKGRRFHCTATIQSLYDYVDSLGSLEVDGYSLVSNFPRTVYGQEMLSLSLKEAGLHPQASLFVELK
ncbi:UNVERIFIED_CONTAM: Plant UBX domain-containing protein 10 [Sesamum latifolium]|uniref:Plant UBX domain-containing protein 10 n=1 Tax=Sesamum latifolium TaxID=2727402 RepID=A0AAW2X0N4_9LAMI